MTTKRILLIGAVFLVASLGLVATFIAPFFSGGGQARLHSTARKNWKDQAIVRVTKLSADQRLIANELASLREASKQPAEGSWIGTNVLLMTNGAYLVYSHIDTKQNYRIHDLFLAHGSDGKWYYSTFHFCIDMIVLRMDGSESPGSLAEFTNRYFVREFDGKSDVCLEKTWPPKK